MLVLSFHIRIIFGKDASNLQVAHSTRHTRRGLAIVKIPSVYAFTSCERPAMRIQISRIDAIWGRLDRMSRPELARLWPVGSKSHLVCAVIHPRIVHDPPKSSVAYWRECFRLSLVTFSSRCSRVPRQGLCNDDMSRDHGNAKTGDVVIRTGEAPRRQ